MRRHSALALFSFIGGLLLALSVSGLGPASVALAVKEDYGFSGPRHQGVGLPTSDKPQSKLWFNDGRWWGSLYNEASAKYHIYWLDLTNPLDQKWIDTGTELDPRPPTMADILWETSPRSCTSCRAVPARMPGLCAIATTRPPSSTLATSTRSSYGVAAARQWRWIRTRPASCGSPIPRATRCMSIAAPPRLSLGRPLLVPGAATVQCRRYFVAGGLQRSEWQQHRRAVEQSQYTSSMSVLAYHKDSDPDTSGSRLRRSIPRTAPPTIISTSNRCKPTPAAQSSPPSKHRSAIAAVAAAA